MTILGNKSFLLFGLKPGVENASADGLKAVPFKHFLGSDLLF
jgi:hypothetical protein